MSMSYKPISSAQFAEAAIQRYNNSQNKSEDKPKMYREAEEALTTVASRSASLNRFASYSESVTNALIGECVYHVFKKAMDERILGESNVTGIMRAMVSDFLKEDAAGILNSMRNRSAYLSEMHELVNSTRKAIFEAEGFDKKDPSTFHVDPSIQQDFFNKLDGLDDDEITDSIRSKVASAMEDFMVANKHDHEAIKDALTKCDQKIHDNPDATETVKEGYQQLCKLEISKIRNRSKKVFESMVSAMCESVIKNDDLKDEFMIESKLDMPKIVDRIQTMYTFIETVNTMNLYKIDEEYLNNLIEALRA